MCLYSGNVAMLPAPSQLPLNPWIENTVSHFLLAFMTQLLTATISHVLSATISHLENIYVSLLLAPLLKPSVNFSGYCHLTPAKYL